MPTLTIDGVEITTPGPVTILEAAKRAGIEIPHYCYHPGLSVVGQCRMCQVEVEKAPKLLTACNTAAADGMVVWTRSPKVEKARRAVLEFYLLNHPLDCPICDKGGECPLQDYTLRYGPGESRSVEEKVQRTKHRILGPHIVFDAERCILCTRCIRFCQEVPKSGELGVFSRGDRSEINLFPGKVLDNLYSGNVIDLCPVGALTAREYRFRSRPWDLVRHTESVCPLCSAGCNVILDVRHRQQGEELLRIRPRENPEVNRWWMCDEGRFTFGYFADPARLHLPRWREGDRQIETDYAPLVARAAQALCRVLEKSGPDAVGGIVSSRHTNEELFVARRFFREVLGTPHLDFRVRPVQDQPADESEDGILRRTDKTPNSRGARALGIVPAAGGLDTAGMLQAAREGRLQALFVFDEDLTEVFSEEAVREALRRLDLVVASSLFATRTTAEAHAVLPALGFAEKTGSFTNYQGRIQRIAAALNPPLASRSLVEFLNDLARGLGRDLGPVEPSALWDAIGRMPGPFHGIDGKTWDAVGSLGCVPSGPTGESGGAVV
jgi:NADH-quinone oxidoreductase subunit G